MLTCIQINYGASLDFITINRDEAGFWFLFYQYGLFYKAWVKNLQKNSSNSMAIQGIIVNRFQCFTVSELLILAFSMFIRTAMGLFSWCVTIGWRYFVIVLFCNVRVWVGEYVRLISQQIKCNFSSSSLQLITRYMHRYCLMLSAWNKTSIVNNNSYDRFTINKHQINESRHGCLVSTNF